jgi:hypothetical protein
MKSTLHCPHKTIARIKMSRSRSQKQIFIFRFFEEHAPNDFAPTRCTPHLNRMGTFENLLASPEKIRVPDQEIHWPQILETAYNPSLASYSTPPPHPPPPPKKSCTALTSQFLFSQLPFSNYLFCPSLSFEKFPLFCICFVLHGTVHAGLLYRKFRRVPSPMRRILQLLLKMNILCWATTFREHAINQPPALFETHGWSTVSGSGGNKKKHSSERLGRALVTYSELQVSNAGLQITRAILLLGVLPEDPSHRVCHWCVEL